MTFEEKVNQSESRIFKAVFPDMTNHHNTMHGGEAMKMMDEIAFITATRFCRKGIVTISSDRIDYKKPLPAGTIVEIIGRVKSVGNTSLKVEVEVFVEEMYSTSRVKAIHGIFTLVAIDENKQSIKVLD